LSLAVTLTHTLGPWSSAIEAKATASKSQADPLRHEPFTPGYAVLNLRTSYDWRNLRLDAGIDNLLNQQYYSPLGGIDLADWRANGSSATTPPTPLAAPGRSFNAGVTVKF
jgi:iron complex outermembrane receptor protein